MPDLREGIRVVMLPQSRIEQFKNAAPGTRVREIMPPPRPKAEKVRREGKRK